MVSIPPPGGRGVLPDIPLILSNAAPNISVPAYCPLTMQVMAGFRAYWPDLKW
jgi:hypothetical protein